MDPSHDHLYFLGVGLEPWLGTAPGCHKTKPGLALDGVPQRLPSLGVQVPADEVIENLLRPLLIPGSFVSYLLEQGPCRDVKETTPKQSICAWQITSRFVAS